MMRTSYHASSPHCVIVFLMPFCTIRFNVFYEFKDSCEVCCGIILQIQMYQLSRLLHDFHKDLYDHFEMNEIAPTLYAAPWFLTIFASQFPIGFVARVFGTLGINFLSCLLPAGQANWAGWKDIWVTNGDLLSCVT
jgi:hypothetical protein